MAQDTVTMGEPEEIPLQPSGLDFTAGIPHILPEFLSTEDNRTC
jgi:hypothetical protein